MIIFILPGLPFFQSVIFSNGPQSRKASHFSPSSSSNSFFCSLVCLKAATNTLSLRAIYALEQQRTSLNLHTKTDAIMSMQEYAAFGNIIICCNLLNSYSSQGKLFSDGLGGKTVWRIPIRFEQFQKLTLHFVKRLIEQTVADLLVDDNLAYSSSFVVEHKSCHPALCPTIYS